ncbi:MAG: ABC transporter permease, partial [Pseudomonas sp.]
MSQVSILQAHGGWRSLLPLTLPLVFVAIVVVFAWQAPGFLSGGNLKSLVLNNFVLLAIVAIGMTYA